GVEGCGGDGGAGGRGGGGREAGRKRARRGEGVVVLIDEAGGGGGGILKTRRDGSRSGQRAGGHSGVGIRPAVEIGSGRQKRSGGCVRMRAVGSGQDRTAIRQQRARADEAVTTREVQDQRSHAAVLRHRREVT